MAKCHIVGNHMPWLNYCFILLCMLGNICFLSSTDFDFQNHFFQEYLPVSKCLDPDHFVEPGLGLNNGIVYCIYQRVTYYNFLI